MTRRAFLATAFGGTVAVKTVTADSVVHVKGRLMVDTPDLQSGYYMLCGTGTGQCQAKAAIAISVHPDNPHNADLAAMVGRDVQLSIY